MGHKWLSLTGGGLDVRRLMKLQSDAGHLARRPHGLLWDALRTRRLAWWRYHQFRSAQSMHQRRFHAWRWEAQIADFLGEGESNDPSSPVGWMQRALDRSGWKRTLSTFLAWWETR